MFFVGEFQQFSKGRIRARWFVVNYFREQVAPMDSHYHFKLDLTQRNSLGPIATAEISQESNVPSLIQTGRNTHHGKLCNSVTMWTI